MKFHNTFIPYQAYWSTPFCKWQGALSRQHPLKLAANCAKDLLGKLPINADHIDALHFGATVPQHQCFFGAPWIAAMLGAEHITGPTIAQACATSARILASAGSAVSLGQNAVVLAIAADRISNGPHIYYPDPKGPGGMGISENWVWDNFNNDPHAKVAMVQTAENIAARFGFSREEQDDLTLHRFAQYQDALAKDRAFQKRYMRAVHVKQGRKSVKIDADEGVAVSTAEGLRALSPVLEGGTVSYAAQTHPADGNAGTFVCTKEAALTIAPSADFQVELLSYGEGRADKAHMGMAPVPAAQAALKSAGLNIGDIKAIKTHNPFTVNDLYFAQATGIDAKMMNNYGSSLIFGHPQGPTGLRLVIELIEELTQQGGGYGLMTGCAAGDTGAAIVIKVD